MVEGWPCFSLMTRIRMSEVTGQLCRSGATKESADVRRYGTRRGKLWLSSCQTCVTEIVAGFCIGIKELKRFKVVILVFHVQILSFDATNPVETPISCQSCAIIGR